MSSGGGRPGLQIPIPQPWFATLSRGQRVLAGTAVGTLVFIGGGVLDWSVTREYIPRISLMLGGAAVALAVGVLVYQLLTDVQERYQAMEDRLRRIVELNHHIRNALQVIAYHNVPERNEKAVHLVNAEIVRMEAVLREVSAALGDHGDHAKKSVGGGKDSTK